MDALIIIYNNIVCFVYVQRKCI